MRATSNRRIVDTTIITTASVMAPAFANAEYIG
jgi:hypothetical protein